MRLRLYRTNKGDDTIQCFRNLFLRLLGIKTRWLGMLGPQNLTTLRGNVLRKTPMLPKEPSHLISYFQMLPEMRFEYFIDKN